MLRWSGSASPSDPPLEKPRIAANDLRGGLGHPIGLGLAVGVRRPAVALAVVVSLWAKHHPSLAADRQRSLPEVKAAAVQAPLPRLLRR